MTDYETLKSLLEKSNSAMEAYSSDRKSPSLDTMFFYNGSEETYHPHRFRNAAIDLSKKASITSEKIQHIVEALKSLNDPALDIELANLRDDSIDYLGGLVADTFSNAEIVDASGLTDDFADNPTAIVGSWRGFINTYVHFGHNRFTSKYFKSGYEGAYLITTPAVGNRQVITAVLVVSPEFPVNANVSKWKSPNDVVEEFVQATRHTIMRAVIGGGSIDVAIPDDVSIDEKKAFIFAVNATIEYMSGNGAVAISEIFHEIAANSHNYNSLRKEMSKKKSLIVHMLGEHTFESDKADDGEYNHFTYKYAKSLYHKALKLNNTEARAHLFKKAEEVLLLSIWNDDPEALLDADLFDAVKMMSKKTHQEWVDAVYMEDR